MIYGREIESRHEASGDLHREREREKRNKRERERDRHIEGFKCRLPSSSLLVLGQIQQTSPPSSFVCALTWISWRCSQNLLRRDAVLRVRTDEDIASASAWVACPPPLLPPAFLSEPCRAVLGLVLHSGRRWHCVFADRVEIDSKIIG